jgi:hypothetical protein
MHGTNIPQTRSKPAFQDPGICKVTEDFPFNSLSGVSTAGFDSLCMHCTTCPKNYPQNCNGGCCTGGVQTSIFGRKKKINVGPRGAPTNRSVVSRSKIHFTTAKDPDRLVHRSRLTLKRSAYYLTCPLLGCTVQRAFHNDQRKGLHMVAPFIGLMNSVDQGRYSVNPHELKPDMEVSVCNYFIYIHRLQGNCCSCESIVCYLKFCRLKSQGTGTDTCKSSKHVGAPFAVERKFNNVCVSSYALADIFRSADGFVTDSGRPGNGLTIVEQSKKGNGRQPRCCARWSPRLISYHMCFHDRVKVVRRTAIALSLASNTDYGC